MTKRAPRSDRAPEGVLLYGVPEIARYLGVRPKVTEHLIASGRLPVVKFGRKSAIRRETLDRWLADQERAAAPDRP